MSEQEVTVQELFDKREKEESPEAIKIRTSKVFEDIQSVLRMYLDLNEDYYPLIALWIMGTYVHQTFDAYPFLYINAQRGSGKTRLLKIISHLACRGQGQVLTGITESVLFRMDKGATMILDECESIASKEKATLREYLNASYKRGATVKRNKKVKSKDEEGYKLETFEPYRPVAMANIYGMNDILGDRCLTCILEKSNNPAKTKLIENFDRNPLFLAITKELWTLSVVWCSVVTIKKHVDEWNNYILNKYNYTPTLNNITTHNYTELHQLDQGMLDLFNKIDATSINGRNLELIMPLLLLAQSIGDEVFHHLIEITKRIIDIKREEEFTEDKDVSLIDYIASLDQYRYDFITLKELVSKYREFLGEYQTEDNWLNEKWIGKALKRLNLMGKKRRLSRGIEVILAVDRAKEKREIYKTDDKE